MAGVIASCGFASGDRFVVGRWDRSPVGPTIDVMWAQPDGHRVLLAPDAVTAEFVTAVYGFDEVVVAPFARGDRAPTVVDVVTGRLRLRMQAGPAVLRLPPRPCWFTRWVEGPVAKRLLDVDTYGVSPTGVEEWYQARTLRFVASATASVDGRDLGAVAPVDPRCGFGFSEPPRRPSIVAVRPALRYPSPPARA